MIFVTTRTNRRLELDESTKQHEGPGDSYAIKGLPGKRVMLLTDHSKTKHLEIERRISSGASGEGAPTEIVFNNMRFAGYVFNRAEAPRPEPLTPPPVDPRRRRKDGLLESTGMKIGLSCAVFAILEAIQLFYIHDFFVNTIYPAADIEIWNWCIKLSYNGYTGAAFALIFALVMAIKFFSEQNAVVLAGAEAACFMGMIFILGFLNKIFVSLIYTAINVAIVIFSALIPIIIAILIIKAIFFHK